MSTIKDEAVKSIEQLPDDCSLSDIFERLLFLEKIHESKKESEMGNLIEHEEVEKKFPQWLR